MNELNELQKTHTINWYSACIAICSRQFQQREQAYFRCFWRELLAQQKTIFVLLLMTP